MTYNEMVGKYRNPNHKYLVFVDDNLYRVTTSNLRNYVQGVIIKIPNWQRMNVYFRYGVRKDGLFYPLDQVLDDDLNFLLADVHLKSVKVATYQPHFVPFGRDPSEKDMKYYPGADTEAIRAWMMIVRKKFES